MLVILIVLAIVLPGCSHQNSASGNVTIALDVPPTNLDPRIGLDATSERLDQLIFSGLVRRDEHIAIQPDLAERWDIPDPLTYVFHLRSGVRFHNGKPVTSKDVLYTFHSMFDGSIKTIKAATYRIVQSIDAPDDQTII